MRSDPADDAPHSRELVELAHARVHGEEEILELLEAIEREDISIEAIEPRYRSGSVRYRTSHGWEIHVFDDADEWDYVELVISPDGRVTPFSEIMRTMPSVEGYRPSDECARTIYGIPWTRGLTGREAREDHAPEHHPGSRGSPRAGRSSARWTPTTNAEEARSGGSSTNRR